ncbi:SGNH hydrolase domain-containing protein [Nocardioides sp. C4-1]|uniref:SGNH hydrolase domain-containing protein n=1 Tax=Nocardioides sp. C4-1 TaxID=3151851 RepID=UPI00326552E1
MKTRLSPHVLVPALVSALVSALLASLLVGVTAAPSQAAGPKDDFPRLPRQCATPQEKIPSKPVICPINDYSSARPTIVLWGDSHAWMFIPALKRAVQGRNVNLVALVMGSCPPMDNHARANDKVPTCFKNNALAVATVKQLAKTGQDFRVVLSGSWQRYRRAVRAGDRTSYVGQMGHAMRKGTPRLVRTLRSIGADVDVIGQVATVPRRRGTCAQGNQPYACQLPKYRAIPAQSRTRTWVRTTFKPLLQGREPINVNPDICTAKVCLGKVDGVRTWFDDFHLSRTRSRLMAPHFAATVDALAPRRAIPRGLTR